MTKKQALGVIIASAILALLLDMFAGRFLLAKISTWPVLNRWKILSPQAPIVINNTQTVRVQDNGDAGQTASQVEPKLSVLALINNGSVSVAGPAVNLTADGVFVTAAANFNPKAQGSYEVVLGDGTRAPVSQAAFDPATSLEFFRAPLNSVPVDSLADSADLKPGDRIFFVGNSLQSSGVKIVDGLVNAAQGDIEGQSFLSDYPRRSFTASANGPLSAGQAAVDGGGNIAGVWNGSGIISSDVLKDALALYVQNQAQIARPEFGFGYSVITQNDNLLGGLPQGDLVKSVTPALPAHQAGLLAGDIITDVDGQAVGEQNLLEPLLGNYHPGDTMDLSVIRGKTQLSLKLKVGELK